MTEWNSLGEPFVQGSILQWPIPFAESGGTLWLRVPAVSAPEFISLGLADDSFSPPTRLAFKTIELKTHSQVISFDLAPRIESPFFWVSFGGEVKTIDVGYLLEGNGVNDCCSAILERLEQLSSQINQLNITEETMAFYDGIVTALSDRLDSELESRIVTVDMVPDHRDYEEGDQVLFSGTGEVLTLGPNNRWLGARQEESWSVIAPSLDDLEAGGSAALEASAFYDFNAGPERYVEQLLLSNASDRTGTFDMVVPGHDAEAITFEQLGVRSSMTLPIEKLSTQLNGPEIHLASMDRALRVSLLIRYRNTYEFIEPVEDPAVAG